MIMDRELQERIENSLSYNESGTIYKILETEKVPHVIEYSDFPYNKLFIEFYSVVNLHNAFENFNEYWQFTYDTVTRDIYTKRIGRL